MCSHVESYWLLQCDGLLVIYLPAYCLEHAGCAWVLDNQAGVPGRRCSVPKEVRTVINLNGLATYHPSPPQKKWRGSPCWQKEGPELTEPAMVRSWSEGYMCKEELSTTALLLVLYIVVSCPEHARGYCSRGLCLYWLLNSTSVIDHLVKF